MLAEDNAFPKSHAGVLHEFGKRYVKTGTVEKGLHTTLARLESKRNLADYGSGEALNRTDAQSSVAGAEAVLAAARAYVKG
jgi:uncharacterized protein (UPF0332 family)